jgi:hypothetical protein
MRPYFFLFLLSIGLGQWSIAQETLNIDPVELLNQSQEIYEQTPTYMVKLNYTMFGDTNATIPLEAYSGKLTKNKEDLFLRIHKTYFINNPSKNLSVKIFNEDQIIEVYPNNEQNIVATPMNMQEFIKYFPTKKVLETNTQYICVLTTGKFTQFPYGTVKLFIDKASKQLQKQELYFLSKMPYKDHNGIQKEGFPRMEIKFSNFNTNVSKNALSELDINQYITEQGKEYYPSNDYNVYKVLTK